jgi:hypothetical protein
MMMTKRNGFFRLLVGCTAVLFMAACGGGGDGGGGGGGGGGPTITKEATLTLGQEVPAAIAPTPPATNPITGTVTVTLTTASNAVNGTLTLTGDYTRVTAAHIHDGDIGTAGGVIIGLVDNGNGSWSVPANASFTAAQAERFKAGGYYVNAHTTLNAAGEIRGQLLGFADNIQPIFTASCAVSTCHVAGSSTGAPMSLASGVSVANLVGQVASGSAGTRVIAGEAANSVLVTRIGGSTAGRMPPTPAPLLPANEQNLSKVWIDMGAKNN